MYGLLHLQLILSVIAIAQKQGTFVTDHADDVTPNM